MPEKINSKRLIFPSGEQALFLTTAKERLSLSWPKFARSIEVHPRVLNDWKREVGSMSAIAGERITDITGIKLPDNVRLEEPFWYTSSGGKKSGRLLYEKNGSVGGDSQYRKLQWQKWWEETGYKNNLGSFAEQKGISIPLPSEQLAELAGIILGDGGITSRQIKITLDSLNDNDYIAYVTELFIDLFGVVPSIRKNATARAIDIVISRTKLVEFWERMGIPHGNKTKRQADIPLWIKKSEEFQVACVRGLMDTDGCIFNECHTIKGKKYCYPRISFVNRSQPLLNSVCEILTNRGFGAKIRGGRAVTLEKREDVIRYFTVVGTHNPKHAKRFADFTGGVA